MTALVSTVIVALISLLKLSVVDLLALLQYGHSVDAVKTSDIRVPYSLAIRQFSLKNLPKYIQGSSYRETREK